MLLTQLTPQNSPKIISFDYFLFKETWLLQLQELSCKFLTIFLDLIRRVDFPPRLYNRVVEVYVSINVDVRVGCIFLSELRQVIHIHIPAPPNVQFLEYLTMIHLLFLLPGFNIYKKLLECIETQRIFVLHILTVLYERLEKIVRKS